MPRSSSCLYQEQEDERGIAYCLALLGMVAVLQGQAERATPLLEESVERFRDAGDSWGLAHALDRLAFAARDQGHYACAAALHGEGLALRQALGDQQGIAVSQSN